MIVAVCIALAFAAPGAVGFAIYGFMLARENRNLFGDNVHLKISNMTAVAQADMAEAELRAYKVYVQELEAEEGPCVIDPETAERLPVGSIRGRIDDLVRAEQDRAGIRAGAVESVPGPVDEDADDDPAEQPMS